ncbi:MAG: type IV toxin-antitoxin system AbiEi family antitoxin domain-containing protein [Solirubrobacteraceae bacterium]
MPTEPPSHFDPHIPQPPVAADIAGLQPQSLPPTLPYEPPDGVAAEVTGMQPQSLPRHERERRRRARQRAIAALAASQHGAISRGQLIALGVSRGEIASWLAAGHLHRVHHGVYAVGRADLPPKGRLMAAVLACGPAALLSHRSAADHWDLLATAQSRVDVTVPGTSRAQRDGIRVHRARTMAPDEASTHHGIPVTSPARTLLDLAAILTQDRTLRAVEQADRVQLLDVARVLEVIARHPSHRGSACLRAIIADYAGPPDVRSGLERDFQQFVSETGLPQPLLNVTVAGCTVDAYWPAWRLAIELDSRAFHLNRSAFEKDRVRDAKLIRAGERVLRVTHKRLHRERAELLDDILALAALAALANAAA